MIARLVEVVRELLGVRRGILSGVRLDRLADGGMHAAPLALQKLEQDALAREGVTEGIAVGPSFVGALDDELRVDRRSQGTDEIRIFQAGHAEQEIEVEVLADDRRIP